MNIGKQIAVLDRGFVYVGDVSIEGAFCRITDAKNIRLWGTTKGLGELVCGPTKETKHDHAGELLVPITSILHFIKCTPDSKW